MLYLNFNHQDSMTGIIKREMPILILN